MAAAVPAAILSRRRDACHHSSEIVVEALVSSACLFNSAFENKRRYNSRVTIDYLSNHRASIPKLAAYGFKEWRPVYDQRRMSVNDVIASFEARTNTDKLPLAVVAIEDHGVIGTGCLKPDDLEIRPDLTPWLGGLFVVPEHRNRGVATAIIQRLLEEARRLQLSVLYLWTPSAESLYARLGWQTVERLDYCGYSISVMQRSV